MLAVAILSIQLLLKLRNDIPYEMGSLPAVIHRTCSTLTKTPVRITKPAMAYNLPQAAACTHMGIKIFLTYITISSVTMRLHDLITC
jgi:hypothetical protein